MGISKPVSRLKGGVRRRLGIDLGRRAIKVVALEWRRGTARLCGFGIEAMPPAGANARTVGRARIGALRRAVAAAAPRARQAATGIPAEAIITRTMHLPAGLDEAALRARVQLDIEDSVKQPAGDIAYDFRPLDEAPRQDQQALLLVATRREEVAMRERWLASAGLRCRLVDTDAHALARAALADPRHRPAAAGPAVAVLDIGSRLRLTVLERQRILYHQDHAHDAQAGRAACLESLERALAMYHDSPRASPPAALGLAGGGSDAALAEALGERLSMPVACLDPRPALGIEPATGPDGLAARLPCLLTAIGLALHAGDPHAHWR
mgnify:CR=1 FL=1